MYEEEDSRALKWRREKWRREWIAKFAQRQRIEKKWIAFVKLADWCAQSTTAAGIDEEEKARDLALRRLADSILKGEFEIEAKSKLLYLDPFVTGDGASPRCRLTREQFEIAFEATAMPPAPSLPLLVLNRCWLPRELARRWLESHGYRSTPHFEPAPIKLAPGPSADFDIRLGWISLVRALDIIGDGAWEQVKAAIHRKRLPAQCRADGVTRDFEPGWLDFLSMLDPSEAPSVLWFDREKAWRKAGRPPDRAQVQSRIGRNLSFSR